MTGPPCFRKNAYSVMPRVARPDGPWVGNVKSNGPELLEPQAPEVSRPLL
jgi:hypothetical protein